MLNLNQYSLSKYLEQHIREADVDILDLFESKDHLVLEMLSLFPASSENFERMVASCDDLARSREMLNVMIAVTQGVDFEKNKEGGLRRFISAILESDESLKEIDEELFPDESIYLWAYCRAFFLEASIHHLHSIPFEKIDEKLIGMILTDLPLHFYDLQSIQKIREFLRLSGRTAAAFDLNLDEMELEIAAMNYKIEFGMRLSKMLKMEDFFLRALISYCDTDVIEKVGKKFGNLEKVKKEVKKEDELTIVLKDRTRVNLELLQLKEKMEKGEEQKEQQTSLEQNGVEEISQLSLGDVKVLEVVVTEGPSENGVEVEQKGN